MDQVSEHAAEFFDIRFGDARVGPRGPTETGGGVAIDGLRGHLRNGMEPGGI
jgi:hypothetical protein